MSQFYKVQISREEALVRFGRGEKVYILAGGAPGNAPDADLYLIKTVRMDGSCVTDKGGILIPRKYFIEELA